MCMIENAECFQVHGSRDIKKSRKGHKCTECGRIINVGEPYRIYSGLFDGEWDHYPTCQHCLVVCQWLTENCSGFCHSAVYQDIAEHAREYRLMSLYRLEVGMLWKWKAGTMRVPKLPQPLTIQV